MLNLISLIILVLFTPKLFAYTAKYGDPCASIEDCSDHRYNCSEDVFNIKRCLCDEFHNWISGEGCIQIFKTSYIMNKTVYPEHNRAEHLEQIDDQVFQLIILAALFLLTVILIVVLIVIGYCIHMEKSDRALAKTLEEIIVVNKAK